MKELSGKHFLLIVENNSIPLDRRVWREACSLRDAGAKISVICPRMMEDNELLEEVDGIQIYRYTSAFSNGTMWGYIREYAVAFIKTLAVVQRLLFQRHRVHVVHVANPPDIFWPLALYCRLWGIKFIFDEHDLTPATYLSRFAHQNNEAGFMYRILVWMEKLSYRVADSIISTNNSFKANAIDTDQRYKEKIFVVRNGPDTRIFSPTVPYPEYKKGRRFLAAYIGVMAIQDGVDYIIRAVDTLVKERRFNDFIVYIIGTGDEWERLRTMCNQFALNDYIVFTGFLDVPDHLKILSTADVCLSPDPYNTMNDKSTMVKVMEYMALGKPIVSFDLKETRYSAGESAYYVANNDAGAFADGMLYLFNHPEICTRMGTIGRRRIDESFCWQIQSECLLQAYRFVLSR